MDGWACNKSPWSYSRHVVGLTFVLFSFSTKLAKENRPITYDVYSMEYVQYEGIKRKRKYQMPYTDFDIA